ncbi:MAG TPA: hypothetical protein VGN01_02465 [Acidobacteriaceae bacterium]|jgi:hypothetical protein
MARFTHRQDSSFSHTSICLKCFRVVATRDRESELRADEAVHSCKVTLPGEKPDPTYWGVGCRTCKELIAFGASFQTSAGVGAGDSRPGTIRCGQGHSHIYFPHDFRQFPSPAAITEAAMEENVRIYKAVNPTWEPTADTVFVQTSLLQPDEDTDGDAASNLKLRRPASLMPDPRREMAKRAAHQRWETWAQKKTLPVQ